MAGKAKEDRVRKADDKVADDRPPVNADRSQASFELNESLSDELAELSNEDYDEDPLAGGDLLDEEELAEYLEEEDEDELDAGRTGDYQEAEQQGRSFDPRDSSLFIESARYGDAELVPGITGSSRGRLEHLDVEEDAEAPEQRADEDVLEDVNRALLEDPTTSGLSLDVEVHEGVVTLRGEVLSTDDGDNASLVASTVPGVEDAIDETTVQGL